MKRGTVCCSVLQCVAVCCNVLQCVAVCCDLGVPLGIWIKALIDSWELGNVATGVVSGLYDMSLPLHAYLRKNISDIFWSELFFSIALFFDLFSSLFLFCATCGAAGQICSDFFSVHHYYWCICGYEFRQKEAHVRCADGRQGVLNLWIVTLTRTHIHTHTHAHTHTYTCTHTRTHIHRWQTQCFESINHKLNMTVSTEIATPPKSTRSRNSNSSVSRGTDSNWDLGLIWIFTKEFECLDLVDFGGVAFAMETAIIFGGAPLNLSDALCSHSFVLFLCLKITLLAGIFFFCHPEPYVDVYLYIHTYFNAIYIIYVYVCT